jgi:hypothetical protein
MPMPLLIPILTQNLLFSILKTRWQGNAIFRAQKHGVARHVRRHVRIKVRGTANWWADIVVIINVVVVAAWTCPSTGVLIESATQLNVTVILGIGR